MAGHKNEGLRARVLRECMKEQNRESTDSALAIQLRCSRHIVTTCRRQLIADGLLSSNPKYKDGAAMRGGYIRGEDGDSERDHTWVKGFDPDGVHAILDHAARNAASFHIAELADQLEGHEEWDLGDAYQQILDVAESVRRLIDVRDRK